MNIVVVVERSGGEVEEVLCVYQKSPMRLCIYMYIYVYVYMYIYIYICI